MLESFGRTFLALGPPVILLAGTVATVLLAGSARGGRRWWVLAAGPVMTLVAAVGSTWFVVTVLQPGEGSGFLLGGAALALYAMAMAPYYLVLLVMGLWVWARNSGTSSSRR